MFNFLKNLARRSGPVVHVKDAEHVWEPIRKGFELNGPYVCRCGALGTRSLRAGKNSISLGDGTPGNDIIRWSATFAPQIAGDIGMNVTTGRPQALAGGRSRGVGMSDDYGSMKRRGVTNVPSSTTLTQEGGLAAPTVEGTPSLSNLGGIGQFVAYSTGAVSGNDAGWIAPTFDVIRREHYARFEAIIVPNFNTVLRMWIGLFSGDPMGAADPAGLHLAAFRLDTGAGDATWKCCVKDGVTLTVVDTALAVSSSGWYLKLDMDSLNGNVRFSLGALATDGITPSTFTVAAVPGAAVDLGYCIQMRTLEAVSKVISIARMGISELAPLK